MKTLKELNEKCTLITEYKQPAWVARFAHVFNRANKAAIYYKDETETFYVYTYINEALIKEYSDREKAYQRFIDFVSFTLY